MTFKAPLISTQELESILQNPDLRVFDGSYVSESGPQEFAKSPKISGAQFFDIDDIADPKSSLPHTIPSVEVFAEKIGALGVRNDHFIVVYDRMGIFSAARVWWMFRLFGHDENKISVLNGGLPKWLNEKRHVASKGGIFKPETYKASFHTELFRSWKDLKLNIQTKQEIVLDARDALRFSGVIPSFSFSKKSGHIPDSCNLPFQSLLNDNKELLNADELKVKFKKLGIDFTKPLIASCGSGVTACILALAAYQLGHKNMAVYDGSWTEWSQLKDV